MGHAYSSDVVVVTYLIGIALVEHGLGETRKLCLTPRLEHAPGRSIEAMGFREVEFGPLKTGRTSRRREKTLLI